MTPEFSFPCNPDKTPRQQGWRNAAFQGVAWQRAELVGAPTGERNGFDVLDIDPAGFGWYALKFSAIPTTRRHETPRGVHLLFRHSPGLRCTVGRIAKGVDVKTGGGYVIWWPRQGYAVDDWPIADWPEWLREEARAASKRKDEGKDEGRSNVYPRTTIPVCEGGSYLVDALRKIDPRDCSLGLPPSPLKAERNKETQ